MNLPVTHNRTRTARRVLASLVGEGVLAVLANLAWLG